jgi:5-methylcytosine-specific restriction endonuclease McrA
MSRLLARIQRQALGVEQARAVEEALRESGAAASAPRSAPADVRGLRGIPVIGGCPGAIPGTMWAAADRAVVRALGVFAPGETGFGDGRIPRELDDFDIAGVNKDRALRPVLDVLPPIAVPFLRHPDARLAHRQGEPGRQHRRRDRARDGGGASRPAARVRQRARLDMTRIPRPCLRCGALSGRSVCARCHEATRPAFRERRQIGGWDWAKLRAAVRARDGGCVRCGATAGLEVHHVIPLAKGGSRPSPPTSSRCAGRATGPRAEPSGGSCYCLYWAPGQGPSRWP